jgi:hypothetical protein
MRFPPIPKMSFEGNIVVLLSFVLAKMTKNGKTRTLLEEKFKAIIKKKLSILSA